MTNTGRRHQCFPNAFVENSCEVHTQEMFGYQPSLIKSIFPTRNAENRTDIGCAHALNRESTRNEKLNVRPTVKLMECRALKALQGIRTCSKAWCQAQDVPHRWQSWLLSTPSHTTYIHAKSGCSPTYKGRLLECLHFAKQMCFSKSWFGSKKKNVFNKNGTNNLLLSDVLRTSKWYWRPNRVSKRLRGLYYDTKVVISSSRNRRNDVKLDRANMELAWNLSLKRIATH